MASDSPQRIRVLVVDDEPLAREKIREMVRRDSEVEIVGECASGAEAVEAVRELRPDLLLLDVQMPELGGFEVLETLNGDHPPAVIFVTAYDQYAVRAFEVHALDYLLKPFDRERFGAAMARAKEHLRGLGRGGGGGGQLDRRILDLLEEMRAEKRYAERLVVKDAGRVFFLETDEIEWVEAEGNYINVHASKKSHLLRETISGLEAQLDPRKFVRIHRSAIVNIASVRELQPWTHGEYHVILRDGTRLTLSRNYRENLRNVLGNGL
jgi:two-component system LytT family response regulator